MSNEHWANDAGSIIILGRTQTGKTTAAREIMDKADRVSIWVNGRGENRVRSVPADARPQSLDGVDTAIARGDTRINLRAADPSAAMVKLKEYLWGAAERSDWRVPFTVICDEIHTVAPQSQQDTLPSRDAVRAIGKQGQKRNIKLIGITQDPVALDKQTIRQREYAMVFPLSAEQSRYMRDYVDDLDAIDTLPDHAGMLFHANGQKIESVRAESRYAV